MFLPLSSAIAVPMRCSLLRLIQDLKAAGANVWFDQLDIPPGMPWDLAIGDALSKCPSMMVILSTVSVGSVNVRDDALP
jgi:hypothetical protein